MRHKMFIVALVAGFCGFLLRSATAPALSLTTETPKTALSAVAANVVDTDDSAKNNDLRVKLWKTADRLVDSLRDNRQAENLVSLPQQVETQEITEELITIPGAEKVPHAITLLARPAALPSLEECAPLQQVAAPVQPSLETAVLPTAIRPAETSSLSSSTIIPARTPRPAAKRHYREIWAIVTAYCPCSRCCGAQAHGRTSLGGTAWVPGIAADPRALSYGTVVYVPGYGEFTVDDTGGAMRHSWRSNGRIHIDIRMIYHHEARHWGRRHMKIRVYK